jgi:hypothetical protein
MSLLAFPVLLAIVAWIIFPRLMRALAIAASVFVGVACAIDAARTPSPRQEEQSR